VQGVKTPCAFNKTDFSNFLSLKNLGSAGQKDFFDTLRQQTGEIPSVALCENHEKNSAAIL